MDPGELRTAIERDRRDGHVPFAVVATAGTTSVTAVDPVPEIAAVCQAERLWLHVDAAYGGAAAVLDSHRWVLAGCDQADSLVVNPHKWLFTPMDCSVLYCRREELLKSAFSLTPAYLKRSEADQVRNLMDYGSSLGRRFRGLKLWFVLRAFGIDGARRRIAAHIEMAQDLRRWIEAEPDFEVLAPTPFSRPCSAIARATPPTNGFTTRSTRSPGADLAHGRARSLRAAHRDRKPAHDAGRRGLGLGAHQGYVSPGDVLSASGPPKPRAHGVERLAFRYAVWRVLGVGWVHGEEDDSDSSARRDDDSEAHLRGGGVGSDQVGRVHRADAILAADLRAFQVRELHYVLPLCRGKRRHRGLEHLRERLAALSSHDRDQADPGIERDPVRILAAHRPSRAVVDLELRMPCCERWPIPAAA